MLRVEIRNILSLITTSKSHGNLRITLSLMLSPFILIPSAYTRGRTAIVGLSSQIRKKLPPGTSDQNTRKPANL